MLLAKESSNGNQQRIKCLFEMLANRLGGFGKVIFDGLFGKVKMLGNVVDRPMFQLVKPEYFARLPWQNVQPFFNLGKQFFQCDLILRITFPK